MLQPLLLLEAPAEAQCLMLLLRWTRTPWKALVLHQNLLSQRSLPLHQLPQAWLLLRLQRLQLNRAPANEVDLQQLLLLRTLNR